MNKSGYAWLSAFTILISAFLLFQVQPVISKMILPWFGGSPAVWTTCMLFFQIVLLLGYLYAHLLSKLPKRAWQGRVHIVFIAGGLLTLPITPDPVWKPLDSHQPTLRILWLLAANVGLPYFALSATAPLVQSWYSMKLPGRSPYRLYALSNLGSLGALLSYPFLVEPALTTPAQGTVWSGTFFVFASLCAALAIWMGRDSADEPLAATPRAGKPEDTAKPEKPVEEEQRPPRWSHYGFWLLMPATAVVALLGVTNYVCQDVAVVPFLWIIPLSLYLISFIICFDREAWYRRRIFSGALVAAILAVSGLMHPGAVQSFLDRIKVWPVIERMGISEVPSMLDFLLLELVAFLVVLFLICMVCHGELARSKPPPKYLTAFFLMVATGGALGGVFVAIVCPLIFTSYYETNLVLVGAFMIALIVLGDEFFQFNFGRRPWLAFISGTVALELLLLVGLAQWKSLEWGAVFASRNFYGVLSVEDYDDEYQPYRSLYNGRILHGRQFLGIDQELPTLYYNPTSGVGLALDYHRPLSPRRVATVGLGVGTLASYGGADDELVFYEINPVVVEISQRYFFYLKNCAANVEVILGDARVSMERQPPQNFDIIALDAFCGDAIPTHLLTREAFDVYLKHLRADGIIAVHISNKHLELGSIVVNAGRHFGLHAIDIDIDDGGGVADAGSQWLLLSRDRSVFDNTPIGDYATPDPEWDETIGMWTDQYSDLWRILR